MRAGAGDPALANVTHNGVLTPGQDGGPYPSRSARLSKVTGDGKWGKLGGNGHRKSKTGHRRVAPVGPAERERRHLALLVLGARSNKRAGEERR